MHVELPEWVRYPGITGKSAMRSLAQEACAGNVGHAAHLHGKWPLSQIGRKASAMRDLLTSASGSSLGPSWVLLPEGGVSGE